MKLNTTDLWRKWQYALLVLTAIGPIGPSLYCYLIPQAWAMSWVFPALCLILGCFGMLLEKKLRKLYGYIGFVLLAAGALLLLPLTDRHFGYTLFAVPVIYGFALLVILPMADLDRNKEPHAAVFAVGVGLYLFWQVFYRIRITSNDPTMAPAEPGILICFLIFLVLTLFSRNRSALAFASMGRFSTPPVMQRVNTLLTLVFLIAALLLGAVPFIGRILAAPIVWAFQGLGTLLGLFLMLKPSGQAPAATEFPEESPSQGSFTENVYPNEGTALPETVMHIFAVLFILVFAYFLVRILVMLFKFLIRTLSAMIRGSEASGTEAYHDEVSDVRDVITALTPEKKARRLTPAQKKQLSPSQQIRHRYRLLKRRHPRWQASDTVRSQLPEEAAILYERTRYGQKNATTQEAAAFESKTKGL